MSKISHDCETPAQGQQVISAVAVMHRLVDGVIEIFLPKRALTKKFLPGVYEMPGGHTDFGEDIKEGLRREIKEEFEMDSEIGDPFASFTYLNKIKGSHSVEVVFFAKFIGDIINIRINPEDHETYGWFSRDYLMNNLDVMRPKNEKDATGVGRIVAEDQEIKSILKAFDILEGKPLITF